MSHTYCPFIKETCKGNDCILYGNNECVIASLIAGVRDEEGKRSTMQPGAATQTGAPAIDSARKNVPDWLVNATSEEIAADMLEFISKELLPSQGLFIREASRLFWESKGILAALMPPDIQMKMQRADYLAERQRAEQRDARYKERLEAEREELPSLVSQCVDWARVNGFRRLTLADTDTFMLERNLKLQQETRRALYSMANAKLRSKT